MDGLALLGRAADAAACALAAVSWCTAAATAAAVAVAVLHTAWCYHRTPLSACVVCLEELRAGRACTVCEARMHVSCQLEYQLGRLRAGKLFDAECPVCRSPLRPIDAALPRRRRALLRCMRALCSGRPEAWPAPGSPQPAEGQAPPPPSSTEL